MLTRKRIAIEWADLISEKQEEILKELNLSEDKVYLVELEDLTYSFQSDKFLEHIGEQSCKTCYHRILEHINKTLHNICIGHPDHAFCPCLPINKINNCEFYEKKVKELKPDKILNTCQCGKLSGDINNSTHCNGACCYE